MGKDGVKGYRLWCTDSNSSTCIISIDVSWCTNLNSSTCIISIDVTFDKSAMLKLRKECLDVGTD